MLNDVGNLIHCGVPDIRRVHHQIAIGLDIVTDSVEAVRIQLGHIGIQHTRLMPRLLQNHRIVGIADASCRVYSPSLRGRIQRGVIVYDKRRQDHKVNHNNDQRQNYNIFN